MAYALRRRTAAAVWLCAACWASAAHADPAAAIGPNASLFSSMTVCRPALQGSWVAKEVEWGMRPLQGWEAVQLPHQVPTAWTDGKTPVWFRISWQLHCGDTEPGTTDAHLALGISGIRLAGTVYWNDELLWTNKVLMGALSRSWNTPRWWPVSTKGMGAQQTVWVRVVSSPTTRAGLGEVELGNFAQIQDTYSYRTLRQRTGYMVMAGLAVAISCVSLVVWLWRRSERIYLWMGLMQAFWAFYLSLILSTENWPGIGPQGMSSLAMIGYLLFAQCFMVFTLRFGDQRFPGLEAVTWGGLGLWILLGLLPENRFVNDASELSLIWGAVIANGSCWYFPWRAWQTRKPQHILLALCWVLMGVVGAHDIVVALQLWYNHETWMAFTGPLIMLVLGALLGWQVAHHMRRVDRFNDELQAHVTEARVALAQALQREHAQALQHAKLQERVQMAHDLHDGLGGSLVQSMALVEQAPQQLSNERVLSLLKVLRDDLRQVIDAGSSSSMSTPATPVQWLAPLRHRFTQILDELGMQSEWVLPAQWHNPPSALQCMALIRVMEECFANVLKHSRATRFRVHCSQPTPDTLELRMEDNGVGFDVQAVTQAGVSVGVRSMQGRVARIGGRLAVQSSPGCTVLTVRLMLAPASAAVDARAASAPGLAPAPLRKPHRLGEQ